jgi:hypothetical protein
MVRLGQLADAQIPLLADLRAASSDLERFFTELGPFSEASRPAIRSLGDTGQTGSAAIKESSDEIRELKQVARGAGGVGEPLRQFLQTLDDRSRAVEQDLRVSNTDPPKFDPTSLDNRRNRNLNAEGFTGMESLMNYFFWQTLSINSFDGISHLLRSLLIIDEEDPACSPISIEPTREEIDACNAYTGPNQPGIEAATGVIEGRDYGAYDPDPTEDGGSTSASASSAEATAAERQAAREQAAATQNPKGEGTARSPLGELPPELRGLIDRLGDGAESGGGTGATPQLPDAPAPDAPQLPDLPGAESVDGASAQQKRGLSPEQRDRLRGASVQQSAPGSGAQIAPDMLLEFLLGP